jgi:hypothetical protein
MKRASPTNRPIVSRTAALRAALGASWHLYTNGGLWAVGPGGCVLGLLFFWMTGSSLSLPEILSVSLLVIGFGLFIPLLPLWVTLMQILWWPKRAV